MCPLLESPCVPGYREDRAERGLKHFCYGMPMAEWEQGPQWVFEEGWALPLDPGGSFTKASRATLTVQSTTKTAIHSVPGPFKTCLP